MKLKDDVYRERAKSAFYEAMYDNLLQDFYRISRYAKAYKLHYDVAVDNARKEHIITVQYRDED